MPRKSETKSAATDRPPKAKQAQKRKKSVPRKRRAASPAVQQTAPEPARTWTIYVGYSDGVGTSP
jgi:hypothetical protein